jgi:hypothetical protein
MACASLALAGPAVAQASGFPGMKERDYRSIWFVQPSDQGTGRRTVKDSEAVFKHRLLPPGLIRLETDAVSGVTNKTIAPAGTQLFALLSGGPPLYCIAGLKDASYVQSLFLGQGNLQHCFADMDRDGSLDGHFPVGNPIKGVPNIRGKRPKKLQPVRGGRFAQIEPSQMEAVYFVSVVFEGTIGALSKVPTPVFSITFGTEKSTERLTGDVRPAKGTGKSLVSVLGGEFRILERRGDTIDIEVLRPIPPQPFAVAQVTY